MKVLLIEDDIHTSERLSATLSAHHYAVDTIADGASGLDLATQWNYDLIVLDVLLPKLNGVEVCRRLRTQGCRTPILMVTVKNSDEDVIAGLDAGADDYVAKSCASPQLLARVRALLRRSATAPSSPVLTWGLLCLDPASAKVTYNEKEIALRPKEYSLLELFLRYPYRILSRSSIIDHLWSIEAPPVEGSVTNLVKDLRQRLKSAGMDTDLIETVYGLGYRLKTAPAESSKTEEVEIENRRSEKNITSLSLVGNQNDDWNISNQRGITLINRATQRFQQSLEKRIATLERLERSLQTGNLNWQQQIAAQEEVHKLAGGLGTFGYDRASEIAQSIEQLMAAEHFNSLSAHKFIELLEALKQELSDVLPNHSS
ncbi:MAG TPA: response regulator [Allocoleopsis sp.]